MGDIIEALQYIIEFLGDIIDFAVSLVDGMFDLLKLIPQAMSMFTQSISSLPPVVVPFATASISIAIILLVAGRSNNS